MVPDEDQAIVLPWASVMVIMVLLNEAFTCATPETMFLRSRRRTRVASLAIKLSFRRARHARRSGYKGSSSHPGRYAGWRRARKLSSWCAPQRAHRPEANPGLAGNASSYLAGAAVMPSGAYFFLPAIGFALPLRVRALVCVR